MFTCPSVPIPHMSATRELNEMQQTYRTRSPSPTTSLSLPCLLPTTARHSPREVSHRRNQSTAQTYARGCLAVARQTWKWGSRGCIRAGRFHRQLKFLGDCTASDARLSVTLPFSISPSVTLSPIVHSTSPLLSPTYPRLRYHAKTKSQLTSHAPRPSPLPSAQEKYRVNVQG